ncbi:MAG: hypothetical protein DRG58_04430 [Deltaproteobacteria bacterium]|nr:MAG: hypothetical protein DRG58_04430 [Deltaproteobacteria bacterium]
MTIIAGLGDNLIMATVDTLKAYEMLTGADMPDKQARALVAIVTDLQEFRLAEVASKADIAALRSDLKDLEAGMRDLEARMDCKLANLDVKIERVKFDLLKWIIPLLIGQGAFIITILKLLQ